MRRRRVAAHVAGPGLAVGLALASGAAAARPVAAAPPGGPARAAPPAVELREYPVPRNARPHDVAPAADGGVWYTAQGSGELGWLDPTSGATRHLRLGDRAAPHGVIVGPDGAPWVTDGGLNALVRVDPATAEVRTFPLPPDTGYANLNTAAFDARGVLWFTGQAGLYGSLDPATGEVRAVRAPRGPGPYGICATPDGTVYYVSLAASYLARVEPETGEAAVLEPPTPRQGARRVWSDSQGRLWVSEWNAGQLSRFEPATGAWRAWRLPGPRPMAYAVYVDDLDHVWVTDFGANALLRFDPAAETFEAFPHPGPNAQVRQLLGRPGEVWGARSSQDGLVVARRAA